MATLYATNPLTGGTWGPNEPITAHKGGILNCAVGTYEVAANPSQNDVIRFLKLPKGAIVVGGLFTGDDLDTGTETLDIDIGWEANGSDIADTDGFGNMGVLTGDAVTEVIPVASIFRNLQGVLNTEGTKTFAQETWVSGLVNAAANATGTGTLSVKVFYIVP